MTLFPIFADLSGRAVLVIGGGDVAERKVRSLLKANAHVTVGALRLGAPLHALHRQARIEAIQGEFDPAWLTDKWLVIAATDDRTLNERIARLAGELRILVNVVDDPALSSFQVPSIVDRSPLVIAISSSGSAPVLARRIRERIESLFDQSMGALAALAERHRPAIRERRPELGRRRQFYDWLLDGPVAAALRKQQPAAAEQELLNELAQPAGAPEGRVLLVGAGPGDPGLLTLKALRALNEADVILHDRLVSDDILELARRDATLIPVGKEVGEDHEATQLRIHQLLLEHARRGLCVVRLKGGDAFVFGRGGEELEFLQAHGIRYEVVPGITAALACAAYAGIPLTHRRYAQSVQLVTAHCSKEGDSLNWASLAASKQTVAFYMGVQQLELLSRQLIAHGRGADTPFALIENGTRPDQRVLTGRLAELPELARAHGFKPPSLLLVGEAASLSPTLQWFGADTIHTQHGAEPAGIIKKAA